MPDKPGYVDGLHFTEHIAAIKTLRRTGRDDEAAALLLKCVNATEAEDAIEKWGVAPGYYEQLAIIYRKAGQLDDEVAILDRYAQQRKAPGALPAKLAARLVRARELRERR